MRRSKEVATVLAAALKKLIHRPIVYPPAPAGRVLYAVGDIHGRADLLRSTLDRIDRDYAARSHVGAKTEVFLGDYVDRGPASAAVIDILIERASRTAAVFLRGNHEQVMLSCLARRAPLEGWATLGGLSTLQSYGIAVRGREPADLWDAAWRAIPADHKTFLSETRSHCRIGQYLFVHAGVRPGIEIENQHEEDLYWIRDEFLGCSDDFGAIVVHGHTPVPCPDMLHNRINIDTGAFITNRLTAIRIDPAGVCIVD